MKLRDSGGDASPFVPLPDRERGLQCEHGSDPAFGQALRIRADHGGAEKPPGRMKNSGWAAFCFYLSDQAGQHFNGGWVVVGEKEALVLV